MQKLPARAPRAPDDDLARPGLFRLVHFAQERGQHVRALQIEIVPRPVKIRRHHADEIAPVLSRIGLAELDAGDFGDGIPLVGRLQFAGQQRRFGDRLRGEFRINARAAQKQQFLNSKVTGRLDDVVLNLQIFEQELDRVIIVGLDAADFRRSEHDDLRTLCFEKIPHGLNARQVEFLSCSREDAFVAVRLQFTQDRAARQPAMSRHENRF